MVASVFEVAFVVPRSGPSGIYGPSCEASGRLAESEINDCGGILGREVRLRIVDGGRRPATVADEIDGLVTSCSVGAVIGWHTSAVRERLAPRLHGRVPYLYTAVYEGGEHTPGVFMTGETPGQQLRPALRFMADELGVRTWCVVGSDYVWPRATARAARAFAGSAGAEIREENYVGLGTEEFGPVLRRIERSRAQGVLMLLLGSDAVRFNRAFTEMRLPEICVRLSPLMDENMLLATGAANTGELFSAAGYFETLATAHSLDYQRRYVRKLGVNAPAVTSPGESCYEGMTLLARLATGAHSTDVPALCRVADSVGYEGPRGRVRVRNHHLLQRIYIAKAEGLEFDVLAEINQGE
jgi:ABC-type branched-subunit amino acid transport system substrate-binding protein